MPTVPVQAFLLRRNNAFQLPPAVADAGQQEMQAFCCLRNAAPI
jgi:hypothetical protein